MRVLHIIPAMFGRAGGVFGGAERYALELARHMADQTPTTMLTFGERDEDETAGQLRIRVIGKPWYVKGQKANPISARMLPEILRADVVHCHQQHIVASSAAALLCRLSGRKVVVSDLGGGGWDISSYVRTDRWYHAHLHISQYSRSVFGHAKKPWAHVIYGGVDTDKFSPGSGVPRDGGVVFAGRLLPHKGIDDLVKAIPADLQLTIIGRPQDERYLSELRTLGQGKKVVFRHDCDDAGLVDAYRRALCIVLPSVYRTMYGEYSNVPELLGQTLLEGMACGAPAICTDVASLPEVVEEGVSGLVVPPNTPDALRKAIVVLKERPDYARAMGEAARRRVLDCFAWPTVVDRCLGIYKSFLTRQLTEVAPSDVAA